MCRDVLSRLIGLVLVGLVAAGCAADGGDGVSADTTAPVEPTRIGEPGADRSPFEVSYGSATGDGDDLVVLAAHSGSGSLEAALRREDGTWWQLPPVPFGGYVQLASAGDRAIAGGIACTDEQCIQGELAFAMLNDDRSEWTRLDAPEVELPPEETEMTTSPGPSALALFSIDAVTYSIDDRGEVGPWARLPTEGPIGSTRYWCIVDDTYVSAHLLSRSQAEEGVMAEPPLVGEVFLQTVGGSEEPESVGTVPPGTESPSFLCAGGRVTIGDRGTKASLDVDRRTWETGPSNLAEMSGNSVSPITGRLASSPDQSTAFLMASDGSVIRRPGAGLWGPTGVSGHVFGTGAEVLVIADDQTVTRVWPY